MSGNGDLTINGLFTWNGSSTMWGPSRTIANGGLDIDGTDDKSLSGRTLDNAGMAVWRGGDIWASGGGGGIFNNLPGLPLRRKAILSSLVRIASSIMKGPLSSRPALVQRALTASSTIAVM